MKRSERNAIDLGFICCRVFRCCASVNTPVTAFHPVPSMQHLMTAYRFIRLQRIYSEQNRSSDQGMIKDVDGLRR